MTAFGTQKQQNYTASLGRWQTRRKHLANWKLGTNVFLFLLFKIL